MGARGLTFVPVIFTTSGGMREAFQRQIWHPHWKRAEAEDAEMKISEWVSRKRKLMWIGAEVQSCHWQVQRAYDKPLSELC
jgi:hypothetical protein